MCWCSQKGSGIGCVLAVEHVVSLLPVETLHFYLGLYSQLMFQG